MKADEAQNELVATIAGWRCCCDIDLGHTARGWSGEGNSKKDGSGYQFKIEVAGELTAPTLRLRLESKQGAVFEGESRAKRLAATHSLFAFDTGKFFGERGENDATDRQLLRVVLGQHSRLKQNFRNYAFGLSYMPVILDCFESVAPRSILEWGPGRSSLFFSELFPEAEITGVEHNPQWFEHCQSIAKTFPKVTMQLRQLKLSPAQSQAYVSYPLYEDRKYDLIFIDGRLRADCIAIAGLVLAEGGVVMVHDAHRENYQQAYRLFRRRQVICNTALLESPLRTL